jgi:hypothetical protein
LNKTPSPSPCMRAAMPPAAVLCSTRRTQRTGAPGRDAQARRRSISLSASASGARRRISSIHPHELRTFISALRARGCKRGRMRQRGIGCFPCDAQEQKGRGTRSTSGTPGVVEEGATRALRRWRCSRRPRRSSPRSAFLCLLFFGLWLCRLVLCEHASLSASKANPWAPPIPPPSQKFHENSAAMMALHMMLMESRCAVAFLRGRRRRS